MAIGPNHSNNKWSGARRFAFVLPIIVCLGTVLAFQNCTQSGFDPGSTGSQVDSNSTDPEEIDNSGSGSNTHEAGKIYGACTMQLDSSLEVLHNGLIDKNGSRVGSYAMGGSQSWPVTKCPSSGNPNSVECDSGFKPVMRSMSQMSCASNSSQICKTYWITFNCVKL